jgi:hypothetical protein
MKSTRRRFLKLAGTAALAAATQPLLSACGGIVRADLNGTGSDMAGPGLAWTAGRCLRESSASGPWTPCESR